MEAISLAHPFSSLGMTLTVKLAQGIGVVCYWNLVGREQDAAKHPKVHKETYTINNYTVQNVKSYKVVKSWLRQNFI